MSTTTDRDALLALYRATQGAHWTTNTGWGTSAELRRWHGVTVDEQDRVTQIDLNENNLQGAIPGEVGNLQSLVCMSLDHNNLSGPIPPQLGNLSALQELRIGWNQLSGAIPKELRNLTALRILVLGENNLSGSIPKQLAELSSLQRLHVSNNSLTGSVPDELANLAKLQVLSVWGNDIKDTNRKEPWFIALMTVSISAWHFLLPVVDDITDIAVLWAESKDRRNLWWMCCFVFALADAERVVLLLVALILLLCWVPFAFCGTDESRGTGLRRVFKVLNGGRKLRLQRVFLRFDGPAEVWGSKPASLRWPILDAVMWAVVGARSKSSAIMSLCGLAGRTSVDVIEESGLGLSLIDDMVYHHPYSYLGRALFSFPYGHHLPNGTATRRSGVMLRAVGETLVVDTLFIIFSLTLENWDGGVSAASISLTFSILELITDLQYYATEARAEMTAGGGNSTTTDVEAQVGDPDSVDLHNSLAEARAVSFTVLAGSTT